MPEVSNPSFLAIIYRVYNDRASVMTFPFKLIQEIRISMVRHGTDNWHWWRLKTAVLNWRSTSRLKSEILMGELMVDLGHKIKEASRGCSPSCSCHNGCEGKSLRLQPAIPPLDARINVKDRTYASRAIVLLSYCSISYPGTHYRDITVTLTGHWWCLVLVMSRSNS